MIYNLDVDAIEMDWLPPPVDTEELPVGLIEDEV